MVTLQCKMCGAPLQAEADAKIAGCQYCGTMQTLPKLGNTEINTLYERAGHYRRNNDFDKAAEIYEEILKLDTTDAEAYWSLVLCSYGVEYVKDPRTGRRVITVNRIQYTSVFDDENYVCALRYANDQQKNLYRQEAQSINTIQKHYLQLSRQEEPFDVFICYKETDENGQRTADSVLGQELYYELQEAGFKVFFSRITLEHKLGTAYEPYIFAALNSSKVMVVVGTKPEHFQAVWVKNEWSRYLGLIRKGAKKVLIPAYRDMDPYDLPSEFSHLQAQNMSKLGFMQDLIHGIRKIAGGCAQPSGNASGAVAPLLKRIEIFLSNGMYADANTYCNKVLDIDPENGQAYIYQLLATLQVRSVDELQALTQPFDHLPAYKNALRFSDPATVEKISRYNQNIPRSSWQQTAQSTAASWQQTAQTAAASWQQTAQSAAVSIQQTVQSATDTLREAVSGGTREHNRDLQRMYAEANRQQIERLKKKRRKKVILCFLFFWFWPLTLIHIIQITKLNKQIEQLQAP